MNSIFQLHRRGIALTVGLTLLTLLAGTALLGLAGHFLTAAALAGATATFNFFGPSAGIRGLTFARILSRYGEKLAGHDTTLRIARDLRTWLFGKLLPLAPFGLGRHRSGDLVTRLLGDIDQLDGLLVRAIGPMLALAVLAVIAILLTALTLPVAGAVLALALLCIGFGIPLLVRQRGQNLEQRTAQARADSRAAVLEGLQGASDLHAMQAEDAWFARVENRSHALEILERKRARLLTMGTGLHNAVVAISLPLLLWLLVNAVYTGELSAPVAGGLFFMTLAVYEAAAGIGLAWQSLQAAQVAQQRLQQLAAQAPGVDDPVVPHAVPDNGVLEFHDVRFHWPETAGNDGPIRDVLHEANLRIEPGQRIALRGDSGSGKSSLLALALRLCDPQAGSVTHAGIDLREFRQADWHAHVTWLPQDAPVFAGSVRDNLRIGALEASDERLWAVLAEVKLDAAIRSLPGGLDTWVGEHGATLSAGQSRRLAFARALLRDTPLLLLDEPTEGLDADTADTLLRDFALASEGRSVLIICHGELPAGVVHASLRLLDGRIVSDD